MKKFLVLVPLIAMIAILLGTSPAFAQSLSGNVGPNTYSGYHAPVTVYGPVIHKNIGQAHVMPAAAPTSPCPGCEGQNPYSYLDSNGIPCAYDLSRPVYSLNVVGGTVTIWYSDACGINWGELLQTNGTNYIANVSVHRADGDTYQTTAYAYDIWTQMTYAPSQVARACGSVNNWTGGCTPWE